MAIGPIQAFVIGFPDNDKFEGRIIEELGRLRDVGAIRVIDAVFVLREEDEILFTNTMHVPYANVIFDLERTEALATVHAYLDEIGVAYCGRYGEWAYIWTDESFMSGENAAQRVLDGLG